MLWGATLRSPHPRARIVVASTSPRRCGSPGVYAVLTHEDVPGAKRYGLEHADQPVLADDEVRYQGEPVALVAADHPEIARRAVAADRGRLRGARRRSPTRRGRHARLAAVHELPSRGTPIGGNLVRHVHDPTRRPGTATAEVVVTGEYEVGMQDQAFLGPESGLAVPAEDGGVDLYVATQWLHVDQRQVAARAGPAAGQGAAHPGRRRRRLRRPRGPVDAGRTPACSRCTPGRPVKMVYSREESFFGHVHRHPALLRYEHGADADGPAGLRAGLDRARRRRVRLSPRRRWSATRRRWASGPTTSRT